MLINFEIEYRTVFGEDLWLNVIEADGSHTPHSMTTTNGITWHCQLATEAPLHYYYSVTWQGRVRRSEWVFDPHEVPVVENVEVDVTDRWMDCPDSFRVAGTLVPVFSLRSEGSFGVGDFGDLRVMVDWVAATGQKLLQVLPINDTTTTHTWTDSYPYSCISVFALHPQYADLRQLPQLRLKAERERFEALRLELNALPQVDYERVNAAKLEYLYMLYQQNGKTVVRSKEYKAFVSANADWLPAYADFCCRRDARLQVADAVADPLFWHYVQYVLAQQMAAVHEHAQEVGVLLKGDIPIGVSRYGADVDAEPRYFNMNGQAGAPPDDFAEDGQNWGFPTYNWDEMLRDGCSWWERRFRSMAKYFDAYRIDHVLGFFRIWEIPMPAKSGLLGQFTPAMPLSCDDIYRAGISSETLKRTVGPIISEKCSVRGDDGKVCDGAFATDYLFLRDHKNPELYHPRISAQKTLAFSRLSNEEQQAFNRLYDDFFYHRHNQFWYEEAMQKLPRLVGATRMLCCAEDLGMVPECVGWVMNELQILSLELESMPKAAGARFGHVENNPRRSVATISSHDTPTLRMWWDEDEERTQDYYNNILHHPGTAPHPLSAELAREIIDRHLRCPSMLCVVSLQDWLATDEALRLPDASAERVNIPANPRHYWRYRMHLTLEQLNGATAFNARIREMVAKGSR
ncbi:MAG: 4-alpha-glucanotransferase [Bacteroidaceae bacterium]|nr:4-alpha-glucanotransferase [Bacteroidaceae bacterium]